MPRKRKPTEREVKLQGELTEACKLLVYTRLELNNTLRYHVDTFLKKHNAL